MQSLHHTINGLLPSTTTVYCLLSHTYSSPVSAWRLWCTEDNAIAHAKTSQTTHFHRPPSRRGVEAVILHLSTDPRIWFRCQERMHTKHGAQMAPYQNRTPNEIANMLPAYQSAQSLPFFQLSTTLLQMSVFPQLPPHNRCTMR